MRYEYCCRDCEGEWNAEHPIDERMDECIYCESLNIYRAVGTTSFILKGGNWAYDGYAQEPGTRSVNLGPPSDAEKRRAKKVIQDRIESTREGVSTEE